MNKDIVALKDIRMSYQTVDTSDLIREIENLPMSKYQEGNASDEQELLERTKLLVESIGVYEEEFNNGKDTTNSLAYHTTDNACALSIIKDGLIKGKINKFNFNNQQLVLKDTEKQIEENRNRFCVFDDLCKEETESTKKALFENLKTDYVENFLNAFKKFDMITKMVDSEELPQVSMSDGIQYQFYNINFQKRLLLMRGHHITIVYNVEGLEFDRHMSFSNADMVLLVKYDNLSETIEYLASNGYTPLISELSFKYDLPFDRRVERIYINKDLEMQSIYIKQSNGSFLRKDVVNE